MKEFKNQQELVSRMIGKNHFYSLSCLLTKDIKTKRWLSLVI